MKGIITVGDAQILMNAKNGKVYETLLDITDNIKYHIEDGNLSVEIPDRVVRENVTLAVKASGLKVTEPSRGMIKIQWKTMKDLQDENLSVNAIERFFLMRCAKGFHLPITLTEALALSADDDSFILDNMKDELYLNTLVSLLKETSAIRIKAFEGHMYKWIDRYYYGEVFNRLLSRILIEQGFRIEYSTDRMYIFWRTDEAIVDNAFSECCDRRAFKIY